MKQEKPPFLRRRIWKRTPLLLILAAVCFTLPVIFPDTGHCIRYFFYEALDAVLGWAGCLPEYDNLNLGAPGNWKPDRIFNREGYAFGYSEKYEQALWVTYKLTREELKNKKAFRTGDFREDPRILSRSAAPVDYTRSGFDRGHLAPAGDMGWSREVMSESFYMSNMTPQVQSFNRGAWKELEELVREFARREGEIFIVTGPVFYPGKKFRTIGRNHVAVPHACYKVVYDLTPPRKMIGFILPNGKISKKKKLPDFAVSVKEVEDATGLSFFPELAGSPEEALKTSVSVSDWGL